MHLPSRNFSMLYALIYATWPCLTHAQTIHVPVAVLHVSSSTSNADNHKNVNDAIEDRKSQKAKPVDSRTTALLALAKKSGCLACHKLEGKLVGPSWIDVAQRYQNDPDARTKLIEKISKGGGGNWREVTGGKPMPPYGQKVTSENIALLAESILALTPQ